MKNSLATSKTTLILFKAQANRGKKDIIQTKTVTGEKIDIYESGRTIK